MGGDASAFGNLGLHIVGPMIGGALAVPVFLMQEAFVAKQEEEK